MAFMSTANKPNLTHDTPYLCAQKNVDHGVTRRQGRWSANCLVPSGNIAHYSSVAPTATNTGKNFMIYIIFLL